MPGISPLCGTADFCLGHFPDDPNACADYDGGATKPPTPERDASVTEPPGSGGSTGLSSDAGAFERDAASDASSDASARDASVEAGRKDASSAGGTTGTGGARDAGSGGSTEPNAPPIDAGPPGPSP